MKIENILKKLPEFSAFNQSEIHTIVGNLNNKNLVKDSIFIDENSICESLFILIEGTVTVYRKIEDSTEIEKIGQLNPGALIGLGSLLGQGKPSASCKAKTDVVLASLAFNKFESICKLNKNIKYKFQFAIAKQLASEMRNFNKSIFNSFANPTNESSINSIYTCEYRGLERRQYSRRYTERRKDW